MPQDDIEWESFMHYYWFFTCIQNKYYLQIYLDNFAYEVIEKQMIDYPDDNLFETDKD